MADSRPELAGSAAGTALPMRAPSGAEVTSLCCGDSGPEQLGPYSPLIQRRRSFASAPALPLPRSHGGTHALASAPPRTVGPGPHRRSLSRQGPWPWPACAGARSPGGDRACHARRRWQGPPCHATMTRVIRARAPHSPARVAQQCRGCGWRAQPPRADRMERHRLGRCYRSPGLTPRPACAPATAPESSPGLACQLLLAFPCKFWLACDHHDCDVGERKYQHFIL